MAGSLQTVTDGKNLQNFLICLEMLPAALGMMFAFPYTEYKGQGASNTPVHSALVLTSGISTPLGEPPFSLLPVAHDCAGPAASDHAKLTVDI